MQHEVTFVFSSLYLNRMQHEFEVITKQAIFVDSSISDTIRTCIVLGNHRAAMKVKTEFKVCELSQMLPKLRGRGCHGKGENVPTCIGTVYTGSQKMEQFSPSMIVNSLFYHIQLQYHLHFCVLNLSQVSEKRWYWLKVFALATIRDWDALEKFSKEKRPPIGNVSDSPTLNLESKMKNIEFSMFHTLLYHKFA